MALGASACMENKTLLFGNCCWCVNAPEAPKVCKSSVTRASCTWDTPCCRDCLAEELLIIQRRWHIKFGSEDLACFCQVPYGFLRTCQVTNLATVMSTHVLHQKFSQSVGKGTYLMYDACKGKPTFRFITNFEVRQTITQVIRTWINLPVKPNLKRCRI